MFLDLQLDVKMLQEMKFVVGNGIFWFDVDLKLYLVFIVYVWVLIILIQFNDVFKFLVIFR